MLVALFVLNVAYYFQRGVPLEGDLAYIAAQTPDASGEITSGVGLLSNLVPGQYVLGLYQVRSSPRPARLRA